MRMRKKKNLEARMEVCAALWVKDPVQMRGAWREKMPGARLLRLELGCGKGRFTAQTAAAQHEDTSLQQTNHCISGKNTVVSTEAFRPDAVLQERDHHLPFGKDGPCGQLPDGSAADEGRTVRSPAQHMRPGP